MEEKDSVADPKSDKGFIVANSTVIDLISGFELTSPPLFGSRF